MFSKRTYGKPVFNLKIVLSCEKIYATGTGIFSYEEIMDRYRRAYENSLLFSKPSHVTEQGYIRNGYETGLPFVTADLSLDDNLVPLIKNKIYDVIKQNVFEEGGMISTRSYVPLIHFHLENGAVWRLGLKYPDFIIEDLYDEFNLTEAIDLELKKIKEEIAMEKAESACPEIVHSNS